MDEEKKILKGEKTRALIIEKAASLFLQSGFSATTTRQITDELGMTRGIIYNYFKSSKMLSKKPFKNIIKNSRKPEIWLL